MSRPLDQRRPEPEFGPPRRAYDIGLYLILASLTMLFASAMGIYLLLRYGVFGQAVYVKLQLPRLTWISTCVMLLASYAIHRALAAIRRERIAECRTWLYVTTLLALLFLAVQFPCLWIILDLKRKYSGQNILVFVLVFFLIALHAAHVIGGVIAMVVVTLHAKAGRYNHEDHIAVRHAAIYWHFLDIVWLIMFAVFLITG